MSGPVDLLTLTLLSGSSVSFTLMGFVRIRPAAGRIVTSYTVSIWFSEFSMLLGDVLFCQCKYTSWYCSGIIRNNW